MRLLDSSTLRLHEFFDINVPRYAILSHTWGDDEVSFRDIQRPLFARRRAGFSKIRNCCKQAVRDSHAWVWIDTCCIDKSSSAELSEAINSMYDWYKNAEVCYAYISDVQALDANSVDVSHFLTSRWFTRGWTLQELIAPQSVVFYDSSWTTFGTRSSLAGPITSKTGISERLLAKTATGFLIDVHDVSIAKRMSWAAERETTRVEDMAYCLMGLFQVNMPLLYGEGWKAFERLQEEIIKISDDQSIFSWGRVSDSLITYRDGGLLAEAPADFVLCGDIMTVQLPYLSTPFWMTNRGLRIDIPLRRTQTLGLYDALLACRREDNPESVLSINLMHTENDGFHRTRQWEVKETHVNILSEFSSRSLYVRHAGFSRFYLDAVHESFYMEGLNELENEQYYLREAFPLELWHNGRRSIRLVRYAPPHELVSGLLFERPGGRSFVVVLGFAKSHTDSRRWATIILNADRETLAEVVQRGRARIADVVDVESCEQELDEVYSVAVKITHRMDRRSVLTIVKLNLVMRKPGAGGIADKIPKVLTLQEDRNDSDTSTTSITTSSHKQTTTPPAGSS